ncbi:MAG: GNAT family N-acetyltransferase [Solirubrobacteraceae bacterium]|nr:GNAT family N-acetyltransferase [Solirubrobacteraceae bacterium]
MSPAETSFVIEPALPADARAVARIHVESWRAAYVDIVPGSYLAALSVDERETMWREAIAAGAPELMVARAAGRVIGWVSFGASRDEGAAAEVGEVWALYVDAAHWSSGLGRALLQAARERLSARGFGSASLWVLSANARAIRFYERAGFSCDEGSAQCFEIDGRAIEERRFSVTLRGG